MYRRSSMHFQPTIIWVLTTLMFASFYTFNTSTISSLSIIVISAIILLIHIYNNHGRIQIRKQGLFLQILLWSVYCFASSIWATQPGRAISKGITIFEILVCIIILFVVYESAENSAVMLLKAVQWGGFIVAIYTIFRYGITNLISMVLLQQRLGTDFTNTNAVGMLMAITITLSFFFVLYDKWKWIYLLIIPSLFVLILTESRTAIVELVFGVSLVLYLRNIGKKGLLRSLFMIIVLAIVLYFGLSFLSQLSLLSSVTNRMEGLFALVTRTGVVDHSASIRQKYIQAGIEQFKRTPLFGIGIGNSNLVTVTVEGHRTYLHNNYVEILACGGIVGFVIYYSMFVKPIVKITKSGIIEDPINAICFVVLLMMLVSDYGTVSYYDKDTFFLLLISSTQLYKLKQSEGKGQND